MLGMNRPGTTSSFAGQAHRKDAFSSGAFFQNHCRFQKKG